MAFSTQKDFFNVPFMNESFEVDCKKACVKLKSYESTIDTRSWSSDEKKQSNFLSDLVTCQQQASSLAHAELEGKFDRQMSQPESSMHNRADDDPIGASTSKCAGKTKAECDDDFGHKELLPLQFGGDSLLECANFHLTEYQKLLKTNITPEKQLELSKESLKTANLENKEIREILASRLDSSTAKDFYNKIQKFTAAGKFNKNEENMMLQIYEKMENMNKAYESLQAENNYLKRLTEKLAARVTLENITTVAEESEDIDYLQNEINSLRKECVLLRQIEDAYHKLKQQQTNDFASISEQDAKNIKTIIKERNGLREKCKYLKVLEQQVKEFEHKTNESKNEVADLCKSLSKKIECINELEVEIHNMQKYYEEKCQNACFREECLKAQLADLKEELIKAKCEAQKANILRMEVSSLRNEVLKRDLSLNDYDCQYKQLMDVVNELQSVRLQCLHDSQTQTCIDQTDELTFYTCATLNEITKELKKRGCFNNEFSAVYRLEQAPGSSCVEDDRKCCQEVKRLQQQMDEMEKEMQKTLNAEILSEDAQKRLKELESENAKLSQDKIILNEKLKEAGTKMINMLQKIDNFDKEISRNSEETSQIGKDLQGAIDLVKDISEVQLKNQQLANSISTINSRDDEKIIKDLRRQLEEEMGKLQKCQQSNTNLLEEAKLREIDLKHLKELNNKLLHDNANLKKIINLTQSDVRTDDMVDITDETGSEERNHFEIVNYEKRDANYIEANKPASHLSSKDSMNRTTNQSQQKVIDLDDRASKQPSRIKQELASLDESAAYPRLDAGNKQPSRSQQEVVDLNAYVTSASKDISRNQSQIKQEVESFNESITSPFTDAGNIQPIRSHQDVEGVTEFVTTPSKGATNLNRSQTEQRVASVDELITSSFEYDGNIQPIRNQQDSIDLSEFVTSPPKDINSINRNQIKQEVESADELVASPFEYGGNILPHRYQEELVDLDQFVRSPSNDINIRRSQIKKEAASLDELLASPLENGAILQQLRSQQQILELDEFITSQPKNTTNKIPSQTQQEVLSLDDFLTSPSKDLGRKQPHPSYQKPTDLNESLRSPSKYTGSKLGKRDQQKDVDSDGFAKSPSKPAASKHPKPAHRKIKLLNDSRSDAFKNQPSRNRQKAAPVNANNETSKRKESSNKQLSSEQQKVAVLDDFVKRNSDTLKHNIQKGRCFEKEFRIILEEFIYECSNCFCRTFNIKSKLYDICHRLCHSGIDTLTFRELAYLHKRIYAQADQLLPGCLLDIILSDHKDQIERMLKSSGISHSVDNKEIDCKISHDNISSDDQKCCCCKSELCCSYSEEMLKDKVNKLEKDIEIAREYLESLRSIPLEANIATDSCDSSDTNNSTYRASTPVMIEQKSRYSKHLKKLKSSMI